MTLFDRRTNSLFTSQAKVMGIALVLVGVYIVFYYVVFGLFILTFALIIFTGYEGFELKSEESIYRKYWGVFGLKFGKWMPLPNFIRISLVKLKETYRSQSFNTGLSTYSNEYKIALNLRINERDFICAAKGEYESIITDALYLSKELGLDIIDATSNERKFIGKEIGNFIG